MGVLVAFILLVILIYKKFPITVAAIICAGIMALLSGMDVMTTLTGDYMAATVAFIKNYFILFLVSAIFGRIMDTSGAAYSIGKWLGSKLGARYAIWGVSICHVSNRISLISRSGYITSFDSRSACGRSLYSA